MVSGAAFAVPEVLGFYLWCSRRGWGRWCVVIDENRGAEAETAWMVMVVVSEAVCG